MRNLKKILALVLALVMSLSLMATASATDTTAENTESPYQTAVDVLKGVGVVKGDDRGDRLTDPITRAEVTALLYRIATGDVADAQNSIHTGQGFTDVNANDWYAGYISYCYIAEIIKGNPNGSFEPDNNINGYATLAMILRAMGYGKNGEFEGDGWEIRTASIAKQIGILEGITDTQLSGNAPRALVFQILFRAIFKDMVEFDVRYPNAYPPVGKNLAKEKLGLEEITGIVMANEYADLEDVDTLPDGKTRMNVDGTNYTLNVTTDLTDIGESRTAYVQAANQRTFNLVVDKLYDTGLNVRAETGDAKSSIASFARSEAGLTLSDAEYFQNFGDGESYNASDYKITYAIYSLTRYYDADEYTEAEAEAVFSKWYGLPTASIVVSTVNSGADRMCVYTPVAGDDNVETINGTPVLKIEIRPDARITDVNMNCIREIFYSADRTADTSSTTKPDTVVFGEVYVGTQSTKDISDEISYKEFMAKYVNTQDADYSFNSNPNGYWLKVVDNNNDGIAEYVFRTGYILDELTSYNSRYDYFTAADGYKYDGAEGNGYGNATHFLYDEPAVGDVIRAAYIDGKWQIEKAEPVVATIKTVNYREETVTTTDGETYDESDIQNDTGYAEVITAMADTTYEIFFDHFGHIRAYRLPAGSTKYALLTEVYPNSYWNIEYVTNLILRAEVTIQDGKTLEHVVTNPGNKDGWNYFFIGTNGTPWTWNNTSTTPAGANTNGNWMIPAHDARDDRLTNLYDYDNTNVTLNTHTNIAAYSLNDDDEVTLNSAAKLMVDKANEQLFYAWDGTNAYTLNSDGKTWTATATPNYALADKVTAMDWAKLAAAQTPALSTSTSGLQKVYAMDYIQLAVADIAKGARHYSVNNDVANYKAIHNDYVDAVHDTEYYLVTPNGVKWFTDYDNVPEISADNIRAIYTLAENTSIDKNARDYWVADIIVIELKAALTGDYDSLSLAYYNTFKTSGEIKHLDTLNNKYEGTEVSVVPGGLNWANQWNSFGFYKLYGTADAGEKEISASSIAKIIENYNDYGIYAGTIKRINKTSNRGGYIDVYTKYNPLFKDADPVVDEGSVVTVNVTDDNLFAVVSWNDNGKYISYGLTMDSLKIGDQIIFVGSKSGSRYSATYLVDASFVDPDGWYFPAEWLATKNYFVYDKAGNAVNTGHGLWQDIINEQSKGSDAVVTASYATNFPAGVTKPTTAITAVKSGNTSDWMVTLPASPNAAYKWQVTATSSKNHDSVIQNSATVWYVTNVTGPVEVVAELVAATADKKLGIDDGSQTGLEVWLDGVKQSLTGSSPYDLGTVAVGTPVKIAFSTAGGKAGTATASTGYSSLVVTPVKNTETGKWEISFNMPTDNSHDLTVTLGATTAAVLPVEVNTTNGITGLTSYTTTGAAGDLNDLSTIKLTTDNAGVTATPQTARFVIEKIETVKADGTTVVITKTTGITLNDATGEITITDNTAFGTDAAKVKITAKVEEIAFNVQVRIVGNVATLGTATGAAGTTSNADGNTYKVLNGGTLEVPVTAVAGLETGSRLAISGMANATLANGKITVTNVTANGTIFVDVPAKRTLSVTAGANNSARVEINGVLQSKVAEGATAATYDVYDGDVVVATATPANGYHVTNTTKTITINATTAAAGIVTGDFVVTQNTTADLVVLNNAVVTAKGTNTMTVAANTTVEALLAAIGPDGQANTGYNAVVKSADGNTTRSSGDTVVNTDVLTVTPANGAAVTYTITVS